ncbi:hypothetical protein FRC03_002542 [Tulasnella sp. 419]|nr:hypothetical protein FRC03_002542 [Tulasnella sp. 419]
MRYDPICLSNLSLTHYYSQEHSTIKLYFNPYDISPSKLAAFSAVSRAVRKLDLDLTLHRPVENSAADATHMIGPEVFMALTILCKRAAPTHGSFFTNLQELTITQDLFHTCSYAFTPMFLPPSTQILTLYNWGRFNIQMVFGYLASVAPHIRDLKIFNDFAN